MKKLLLLTVALTLVTLTTNAQIFNWGVKAGVSMSNSDGIPESKQRTGITAGVFAETFLNPWLAVQSELLYSQRGWDVKMDNDKLKTRLDYVYMPILMKAYMTGGLNIQMGAQFGYLVSGKLIEGGEKMKINSLLNKYDVNLIAGAAYDFDFGLVLEARYLVGLTTLSNNTEDPSIKNNGLMVTAGWKF